MPVTSQRRAPSLRLIPEGENRNPCRPALPPSRTRASAKGRGMKKVEGRELLTRLAEHLREQKLPVHDREVPLAWAQDAAAALELYLSGKAKSLDTAFGLIPSAGRPENLE